MRDIQIGGVYRHFKGNYYYVKGVATHSETREEYIIYQALYGDFDKTYIRLKEMFLEEADINREDNIFKQKYRFELIDMKTGEIIQ